MSAHAARKGQSSNHQRVDGSVQLDCVARAQSILADEVSALAAMQRELGDSFRQAVEVLQRCQGCVVVCGIGKAGLVGRKISASFSSTGTPSYFLHPSEAVHGDLGSLKPQDVVLLLSNSGETDEVNRLLPILKHRSIATVAVTGKPESTLGRQAEVTLSIGRRSEACVHGLAPTTSTTLMMAMGDALALVCSELKGFTKEQFAGFHPGGSLGMQLTNVCEVMRSLDDCRVAGEHLTVRQVLVNVSCPGRRTGAIMLTDQQGQLTGIFTDSDLARLLERVGDTRLDDAIATVMSRDFQTASHQCSLADAVQILTEFKISELPIVDDDQRPVGIVDITDVVGVATDASRVNTTRATGDPSILSIEAYRTVVTPSSDQ